MNAPWFCDLHRVWTSTDCPKCDDELIALAEENVDAVRRVHNHPPYRPVCNERLVDGQLRGACLNNDGTEKT